MLITRFEVAGFKNLTAPVVLEELGEINVVHGDNNVGKSNLMEAMHLFFRLLAEDVVGRQLPFGRGYTLSAEDFRVTGYTIGRAFNIYAPHPIRMDCTFAVSRSALDAAGIKSIYDCTEVRIALTLERQVDRVEYTVERFEFADGVDAAKNDGRKQFAHRFALFLTRNYLVQDGEARPTFALIDETRAARGLAAEASAGILSDALQLRLYDTKNSRDPQRFGRWDLFQSLLQGALPHMPDGAFDVLYERATGRAALFHQGERGRMDVDLMGSGVQQVVAQLAQLLTTDAAVVAVEEPECNLRYSLQVWLRDVFRQVVRHAFGPSQLFLTSHSPAFEASDHFYAMWLDDGVPRVERRPTSEAPRFTETESVTVPPTALSARRSYVTSDGLVEVPPFVLEALDLPRGGGVFFAVRKDDGMVEMLSHRQLLELGGYGDE